MRIKDEIRRISLSLLLHSTVDDHCVVILTRFVTLTIAVTLTCDVQFNQLYLNTVNGLEGWFSDMPCNNYKLKILKLV